MLNLARSVTDLSATPSATSSQFDSEPFDKYTLSMSFFFINFASTFPNGFAVVFFSLISLNFKRPNNETVKKLWHKCYSESSQKLLLWSVVEFEEVNQSIRINLKQNRVKTVLFCKTPAESHVKARC